MARLPSKIRYAGQMYRIAIDPALQQHVQKAIDKAKPTEVAPDQTQAVDPEDIEIPSISDFNTERAIEAYFQPTLSDAIEKMGKFKIKNSGENALLAKAKDGVQWTFSVAEDKMSGSTFQDPTLVFSYALPADKEELGWWGSLKDSMSRGIGYVAKGYAVDHIVLRFCGQNFGAAWASDVGDALMMSINIIQNISDVWSPVTVENLNPSAPVDQKREWAKKVLSEIYEKAADMPSYKGIKNWHDEAEVVSGLGRLKANNYLTTRRHGDLLSVLKDLKGQDFTEFMDEVIAMAEGQGKVSPGAGIQSAIEKDVRALTRPEKYTGKIHIFEDPKNKDTIAKIDAPYEMIYVYDTVSARPKLKHAAMNICNQSLVADGRDRKMVVDLLGVNVTLGRAYQQGINVKTKDRHKREDMYSFLSDAYRDERPSSAKKPEATPGGDLPAGEQLGGGG